MNIAQNVERGCCLFPNKPALIFEGLYFTYKQLNEMANRFANALLGLGIERGDRIGLLLPNIPEFVIAYLGILKIGAIAVSINPSLQSDELKFILNDSGAKVLITTETIREKLPKQDLPHLKHILIAEGKAVGAMPLSDLMANASPSARAVEMERDDPAAILYTSGTTGFPKGATLSHGNVISNMYSMNHCCEMRPNDQILLFLPMFHCFGQNAVLNSGLNTCATIILQRSFDPETVLTSISDFNITIFFGVPTTFILLCDKASIRDLDSVRFYFSAAAGLPVEIAKRWQDKFGKVINQGYGLTETSPLASYNHELRYKLGSIGSPIENVEMKIVSLDDGCEVAPGELGEIVIRGANVMLGYWNRPAETAKAIKNGWFHTGDIGQIDELGYFYIVDRLKDMINNGGLKVYPAEVENVIYQHPGVAEVAVYGVPDSVLGEQVKASVVLKPDQVITEDELIAFCYQKLAKYKVPSTIEFVTSIPKNPTGKILKRLLRQENSASPVINNKTLKAETKTSESVNVSYQTAELIENWIMDWLVRKLTVEAKSIDPSKSFADYGLDSVRAVKLAQELSEWLGYSLEATIVWNFSTIESLALHLANQQIPQPTELAKTKQESNLHTEIVSVELPANSEELAESSDLKELSDAEIADLLTREIATLKQRKLV
ncbi:long-chain-fatty-acid--CoA ligase [Nostocaceae cyanobacterium CENA357]|uniref:Long-chain-fatty-acid--CoA ligase n=1 Tax=Atlanticothrix silvestris CENA357 TaxID=1725252 RepID=A0A8J7HDI8_9CYAN|nr:long-chain-fatty-acid--CoA ligase [Atlanticothrix silvestris]MBH8553201.1 long-chain-fatty-acid--CoA ligase [Atlanticothrix silvestris CENA357]